MKIRASTWHKVVWIASVPAILIALFLIFHPDWGRPTSVLTVLSYFSLALIGGTGALVAILTRFGIIVLVYSPDDKQTMFYRMSRQCAVMDKSIWGNLFSPQYYNTYLNQDDNQVWQGPRSRTIQ